VQSVHAFGEDRKLALLFTIFMVTILVVSFFFVIKRMPLLRARHELDSWVSREAAFLLNNWVLLFAALFVLFATMFPTLTEALRGERLTVGPPFFNKWMLPIGLVLLLLTGIGPLLAWRKSTLANLRDQFLFPVTVAVLTAAGLYIAGVRVWASGLCFALSAFVVGTIIQEFARGARVRRQATGTDYLTALVGLVARNKRRYGGYVVHLGIVLMFLGFAGNGFKVDHQVELSPGQQTQVGHYVLRYDGLDVSDDGAKQMVTAKVSMMRDGKVVGTMAPAKWFFRKHEQEPTSHVAINRSPAEDLYVVMAGADPSSQSASFQVVINPLVDWIWAGFGILAMGTLIALLPETTFSFAAVRVPAGAATTTLVLLLLLAFPGIAQAQHVEGQYKPVVPRTALEKDLFRSIICMCGTCGRQLVGECTCGYAQEMREEISAMVRAGKTRDQVIQYYIDKYGSEEPLAEPINKGFNRLAWLLPYVVGGASAAGIAFAAIRWSRRPGAAGEAVAETPGGQAAEEIDQDMQARLDDELRNLE
jgi:cytochrome c-type biogenesis protein CcmF